MQKNLGTVKILGKVGDGEELKRRLSMYKCKNTVKPVLNGHSKEDKRKDFQD